jgi:hypothetical protein
VFGGAVGAQLVGIAARRIGAAGRSASILAGGGHSTGRAGGAAVPPASITAFQALSGLQLGLVAPAPSHRRHEGEQDQRLGAERRLIASYRTRRLAAVELDQLGALAASIRAEGVRPPRAGARVFHSGSRTIDLGSVKIGPAASRSPSGSDGAAPEGARNVNGSGLGSGVRGRTNAAVSAAIRRARQGFARSRVRVVAGGHCSLDLGRNRQAAPGAG